MSEREELHELVDKLPEDELARIRGILKEACETDTRARPSAFEEIDRLAEKHAKNIADEAWTTVPADASYNHDHYLYGAPS